MSYSSNNNFRFNNNISRSTDLKLHTKLVADTSLNNLEEIGKEITQLQLIYVHVIQNLIPHLTKTLKILSRDDKFNE